MFLLDYEFILAVDNLSNNDNNDNLKPPTYNQNDILTISRDVENISYIKDESHIENKYQPNKDKLIDYRFSHLSDEICIKLSSDEIIIYNEFEIYIFDVEFMDQEEMTVTQYEFKIKILLKNEMEKQFIKDIFIDF